jgi:putative ABC transport system ATP-binding protein
MQPIIEMKDISKAYGKGEAKLQVLDGVSLTIEKGEFVAILGPSGSGKSTLMNLLGLIDTYDSGEYRLDGVEMGKRSDKEYATTRNRKIGFVFQKYNLIAKYTALQNVELPLLLKGEKRRDAKKKATAMLEKVGLADRASHRPSQLSGGQQQRVAIARALVNDASLLLADEPTGNLDQKTGTDVMQTLIDLHASGNTIVLITHDQYVARHANRILRVEDGKITPA